MEFSVTNEDWTIDVLIICKQQNKKYRLSTNNC